MGSSKEKERRAKHRFSLERELRYKIMGERGPTVVGVGKTINLSSAGVLFAAEHPVESGLFIELSINWPVVLDDSCPMRLIVFGRVLRSDGRLAVCSIDKYEFRTSARASKPAPVRNDGMLYRWATGIRRGVLRDAVARV